jgi:hypothetical protein
MHGRLRQRLRAVMSARTKDLETLMASRKLGRLIKTLLPKNSEPLNFNMLLDVRGTPFRTAAKAARAAAATMKEWMSVPPTLHSIAKSLEEDSEVWRRLLDGTISLSADLPKTSNAELSRPAASVKSRMKRKPTYTTLCIQPSTLRNLSIVAASWRLARARAHLA